MKKKTVATLVGGIAAGAALGVLLAPKSGKETRDDLKKAFDDFHQKIFHTHYIFINPKRLMDPKKVPAIAALTGFRLYK